MKRVLLPLVLAIVSRIALAQGADDPMAQLRACSLPERMEQMECLERLSHAVVPPARSVPKDEGWIVSQTRSPVDYSPIVTATIVSRAVAGSSAMQLSIRCRGGRTELAIAGPAIAGRAEDYIISYSVNGGQPLQIKAAAPASGAGVAFNTDAVAILMSLPSEGEIAVHLSPEWEPPRTEFSLWSGSGRCARRPLRPADGHTPSRSRTTDDCVDNFHRWETDDEQVLAYCKNSHDGDRAHGRRTVSCRAGNLATAVTWTEAFCRRSAGNLATADTCSEAVCRPSKADYPHCKSCKAGRQRADAEPTDRRAQG
jgi:hypothetical protein